MILPTLGQFSHFRSFGLLVVLLVFDGCLENTFVEYRDISVPSNEATHIREDLNLLAGPHNFVKRCNLLQAYKHINSDPEMLFLLGICLQQGSLVATSERNLMIADKPKDFRFRSLDSREKRNALKIFLDCAACGILEAQEFLLKLGLERPRVKRDSMFCKMISKRERISSDEAYYNYRSADFLIGLASLPLLLPAAIITAPFHSTEVVENLEDPPLDEIALPVIIKTPRKDTQIFLGNDYYFRPFTKNQQVHTVGGTMRIKFYNRSENSCSPGYKPRKEIFTSKKVCPGYYYTMTCTFELAAQNGDVVQLFSVFGGSHIKPLGFGECWAEIGKDRRRVEPSIGPKVLEAHYEDSLEVSY